MYNLNDGKRFTYIDAIRVGCGSIDKTQLRALDPEQDRRGAHIRKAYQQALANGYLWHEFGDMHLILPGEQYGQEAKSKS